MISVRTKHSPGDWKADNGDLHAFDDEIDETRWSVLCNKDGKDWFIATVENGVPGDTLETEKANAHLIAAAPELLSAVECFLRTWKNAGPQGSHQFEKFDEAVRMAEIALEKALT